MIIAYHLIFGLEHPTQWDNKADPGSARVRGFVQDVDCVGEQNPTAQTPHVNSLQSWRGENQTHIH